MSVGLTGGFIGVYYRADRDYRVYYRAYRVYYRAYRDYRVYWRAYRVYYRAERVRVPLKGSIGVRVQGLGCFWG